MNECICIWPWLDAPEEYRALSPHGGDEDYVAYVPEALRDEPIVWKLGDRNSAGGALGSSDVSEHEVHDGLVLIGAHS